MKMFFNSQFLINQLKYVNWFQGVSGRDEPLQGRVQGELLSKRMARLQEQGH